VKDFFTIFPNRLRGAGLPLEAQSSYSISETFGNRVDVHKSAHFLVRLAQDRSQYSIEFASLSEPANWFDSNVVMKAVEVDTKAHGDNCAELIETVVSNIRSIEFLFERFSTMRSILEKIEHDRASVLLKHKPQ